MRQARVFPIILNYQEASDTIRCLGSLDQSTYRWLFPIVVDNGSDESSVAALKEYLDPTVQAIYLPENTGYAGGNNVGIRAAMDRGADFIWILNPDLVVEPESLQWLLNASHQHPDAGVIGCRIFHGGSDPLRIWYDGGDIDWERGGATSHTNSGRLDAEAAPVTRETDYVTGAAMLIRTGVLDAVGLLPEDYFLYFEETEFNLSVRRHGWKTIVESRARAHHFKRSTGALPTPYYMYYYVRNRLVFGQRHTGMSASAIVKDLEPFVSAWRERVERNSPAGLQAYDALVASAVSDGRARRTGQNPDLDGVTFASLGA